jgi:cbb3-type cytochrome oxidase subunit 3
MLDMGIVVLTLCLAALAWWLLRPAKAAPLP